MPIYSLLKKQKECGLGMKRNRIKESTNNKLILDYKGKRVTFITTYGYEFEATIVRETPYVGYIYIDEDGKERRIIHNELIGFKLV
ncbi:hypothetical protein [Lacrimispora amygdalina]|uniref:hypothetical protein n=1 Tax=Lacrimispora amygdalina TaxID=253257 RepID=UPI000BE2AC5F|nr:hypothetical protein [Lacrimispora amygdalina]